MGENDSPRTGYQIALIGHTYRLKRGPMRFLRLERHRRRIGKKAGRKETDPSRGVKYVCPMHPDVVSYVPGYCARCSTPLELSAFDSDVSGVPLLVRPFDPLAGSIFNPVIRGPARMSPALVLSSAQSPAAEPKPEAKPKTTKESKVNIGRIVVPVDLSAHSEQTAFYALALAKPFGASITFLHVFPSDVISIFTAQDGLEAYERDLNCRKQKLAHFADKIRQHHPQCEAQFRIGDIAEETTLAARELKTDLIVTASYHSGFLGRLFSQAHRIVKQAPCPVLVYHQPNEGEFYGRPYQ